MKRILQIIPTLDRCGAEKQLVLLARGLPRDRFDVHVCVLTRSGPFEAELVGRAAEGQPATATIETGSPEVRPLAADHLRLIGKRWKLDPAAWTRLRTYIRELRPDLVQTWLFAANSYGRTAALSAGVRRLVASERSVDPWKQPHELWIDRRLARRTDRIVVNSSGVRDFYVGHGLPSDKFVLIPNAVEPVPEPSIERATLLAELGVPRDARVIIVVARMWPQKRLKDAIWAADLLKVVRDDVHLLVVGDGPQRARLERYRDQVRIADKVHLLGERHDVPRLLPHCDMLWLTSEYEGLPNAVLEAMAAGLPVVATDLPGCRDLVVPGETGYLYPVGDRGSLARHTQRLLEQPELARRMGTAGRARVASEFSLSAMLARYAALYDELLG